MAEWRNYLAGSGGDTVRGDFLFPGTGMADPSSDMVEMLREALAVWSTLFNNSSAFPASPVSHDILRGFLVREETTA